MNYDDKFTEENAFFAEKNVAVELPELYGEGKKARRGIHGRILLSAVAMLTAVACLCIFLFSGRDSVPVDIPLPVETAEEWRGAFADRRIYESAVGCSVSVRKGTPGQSGCRSGVVISDDGLVLTSSRFLDPIGPGRIYVTFGGGREYAVESIFRDGNVALLKISAEGLESAEMYNGELSVGQGVIAVSEGEYVISAEISGIAGECARLNAMLSDAAEGAPIFDGEGFLVGLAVNTEGTPKMIFARDFDAILGRMKK